MGVEGGRRVRAMVPVPGFEAEGAKGEGIVWWGWGG